LYWPDFLILIQILYFIKNCYTSRYETSFFLWVKKALTCPHPLLHFGTNSVGIKR
jgi:hypothetical protein